MQTRSITSWLAGVVVILAVSLFVRPNLATGFLLLGGGGLPASSSNYQRDVRIFNNALDSGANNNTTPEAQYPGTLGADLAVWKGAAAWASDNSNAGQNFDMDWQGTNSSAGGPAGNTVSWTTTASGCSGSVLAYTESSPLTQGWRIKYCDAFSWADGPGSISGSQYDIESVMAHEYGHALGLDHTVVGCGSCSGAATMCSFICNGTTGQRSISADDQAGLQAIYDEMPADKPVITGLSGSFATGGTLVISGTNFPTTMRVKFTAGTSVDTPVAGVLLGVPSTNGGTQATVTIPAQARTGNVLIWRPGLEVLSNAFPIEIEAGATWADLGGGTAGVAGVPQLELSGPLTASTNIDLDLFNANPSALAVVFISFTSTPAPFLGGTLHAFPVDELVLASTDGLGEVHGSALFPGGASGAGLWFQVGIDDPSVPTFSASLSNGVRGTVP